MNRKRLFFIFGVMALFILLFGISASLAADTCLCLNSAGKPYPTNINDNNALCYTCDSKGNCKKNGMTLGQCRKPSGGGGGGGIAPVIPSPVPTGGTFVQLKEPVNGAKVTKKPVTLKWSFGKFDGVHYADTDFEIVAYVVSNGKPKEMTFYMNSDKCSKGVCTYQAKEEFAGYSNATVDWYINAYWYDGDELIELESEHSSFTLKVNSPSPTATPQPSGKIDPPVLKEPNATLYSRDMGFYWYPAANAEYYEINWWNDRGNSGTLNQNQTDSTCKMNLCIVKTTLPSEGNYSWNVRAYNSRGYSATSGTMSFRIISSGLITPAAYRPNGTISSQSFVAFEWQNIESGVTDYRIQVTDKYTGAARVDAWYSVNNIYRANGICYLNLNLVLPDGAYSWRVKAKNGYSESGWSNWVDFYVYGTPYATPTPVNTSPTPIYPLNTIGELSPRFEWMTVNGASYYQLNVYSSAGLSLLDVTVSSVNCSSGTCSYTPNFTLPGSGTYRWVVTTYGGNGGYWGYAEAVFTVSVAPVQQWTVFITPDNKGYLDPNSRKIIWADPGAAVTSFRVEIDNSKGEPMLQADLTRENALCDGVSCSIQFRTIPAGSSYRMRLTPYSGSTPIGDAVELIFSVR